MPNHPLTFTCLSICSNLIAVATVALGPIMSHSTVKLASIGGTVWCVFWTREKKGDTGNITYWRLTWIGGRCESVTLQKSQFRRQKTNCVCAQIIFLNIYFNPSAIFTFALGDEDYTVDVLYVREWGSNMHVCSSVCVCDWQVLRMHTLEGL